MRLIPIGELYKAFLLRTFTGVKGLSNLSIRPFLGERENIMDQISNKWLTRLFRTVPSLCSGEGRRENTKRGRAALFFAHDLLEMLSIRKEMIRPKKVFF